MNIRAGMLVCMVVLFTAVSAQAAPEFYVTVTGTLQGPFKGELQGKGLEGKFSGLSFEYGITTPRDAATGQATQKRQNKPVRLQKVWGPASLQFYSALLKNEPLAVTIDFVSQDQTGQMVLDHTVKLTGAVVSSFTSHSEIGTPPPTDSIELIFQKIELIDHKLKAAVSETWVAP